MLALCAGTELLVLPPARDFKRAYDGDEGPNTGGMGSYAPVDGHRRWTRSSRRASHRCSPSSRGVARRSWGRSSSVSCSRRTGRRCSSTTAVSATPKRSPSCRSSTGDLLPALVAAAGGSLAGVSLDVGAGSAVTVVLTAGAYPASDDRGVPIEGIERAESEGALVFHSGTALRDGRLVTNGGRLLGVTATACDARGGAPARVRRRPTRSRFPAPVGERTSRWLRLTVEASRRCSSGAPQPTTHCQFYRPVEATFGTKACHLCADIVTGFGPRPSRALSRMTV